MLIAFVMTTRAAWWFAATAGIIAFAAVLSNVTYRRDAERREPEHVESSLSPPPREPRAASTAPNDAAPAAPPERKLAPTNEDEASLMAKLRGAWTTDPTTSIALAREGNRRFPASDDAPERSYLLVRSLVNLGRFEEAKAEAAAMVDTYRDTPYANEVERHLLSNPLTHPSERGYGMDAE